MLTIKEFKKKIGVHITTDHNDKMAGMISLSTSNLVNPFCKAHRACKGSICEKCYAHAQMNRFKNMQPCLANNFDILTNHIIANDELPIVNALVFRFESFGDIYNETQVINYFNICKVNPQTRFALWTKNPAIIERAIATGHEKPENLVILLSSLYINQQADIEKWSFIDKVFTVYDEKTIAEKQININCGARNCFTCQRCYRKDTEKFINEKLK